MIDVEYDVFDYVYPYVSDLLPEGGFKSEFVPEPAVLPHATLIEMDNYTNRATRSSSDEEEYAVVTYEANVYALDKATCREIMSGIDQALTSLNFERLSMRFISNLADTSIYRYVARFRAMANKDKSMFRV